jgi:hypothetical protein
MIEAFIWNAGVPGATAAYFVADPGKPTELIAKAVVIVNVSYFWPSVITDIEDPLPRLVISCWRDSYLATLHGLGQKYLHLPLTRKLHMRPMANFFTE